MIDAVSLAVLKGRLEQIADEMDATLFRSAFNPIIAEARDASHGLYHAETGETLVQGTRGLPIFVGASAFAVAAVIAHCAQHGAPAPGETYAFNDPYLGGTHLNDMRLVRPVFRDGQLFCWLASVGHWLDVGGNVAGNFNPAATESLQEGFRLPIVKLAATAGINADLLRVMSANTRTAMSNEGDLAAQFNALDLGEKRLAALLEAEGAARITAAFAALTDRAAALMAAEIARLPAGRFAFEDILDDDGVTDAPIPIRLTIEAREGRLLLDFTGTAGACAGPLNISRATTIAAVYVALKHAFPDVPANSGVMRAVDVIIPPGSLLDATPPAPVGGYTETILRLIGVVFGALGAARPDAALAAPFGTINGLSMAGKRADGTAWVFFNFHGGGLGGTPQGDGLHHANNPISMAVMPPVEILESRYPIVFTQWALRDGSGGVGRHRGGVGAVYEIEALTEARVALLGERGTRGPFGVAGGGAGAMNRFTWKNEADWVTPARPSKVAGVALRAGGRVRLETPGGGGWGAPEERDADAAAQDRAMGYAS